jgi:glyoxalase superfamily protein
MPTRLTAVEIDALDPVEAARFWSRALGLRPRNDGGADGRVVVVPPGDGGIALRFVPADGPKTAKNRLHLDLAGGPDRAAEVDRLLALGAVRADIGQGEVPWEVVADPEGNEFCVLPEPGSPAGLTAICLDAADTDAQGRFWTAATGWHVTGRGDWGIRLRPADGGGPALVMGPPAAPKHASNRLRFALAPGPGGEVSAEVVRLVAAGAARLDAGVLADPEGNEFHVRGGAAPGA